MGFRERWSPLSSPASAFCDQHPAWRRFRAFPPPESQNATLGLKLGSPLALLPGTCIEAGTPAKFTFDPENPPTPNGGARFAVDLAGRVPNNDFEARGDVLVFDSPPVSGDTLEIVGRPTVTLLLSADAVSCDIFARLCDVDPSGQSVVICDGFVRVGGVEGLGGSKSGRPGQRRHVRKASRVFDEDDGLSAVVEEPPLIAKEDSVPALPSGRSSTSVPRLPKRGSSASILGEAADDDDFCVLLGPLALDLQLFPTAAAFQPGHRIRLCIAGGAFPVASRNLGLGEAMNRAKAMRTQKVTLLSPSDAPEALAHIRPQLQLPVLGGEGGLARAFAA